MDAGHDEAALGGAARWRCPYQPTSSKADASVGCLLGGMIGDALGAGVEGWPPKQIKRIAKLLGDDKGQLRRFFPCIHMGHPLGYVGPPKEEHEDSARCGMYTDDTNAALALASSLVDCGGLNGPHAATRYAEFFFDEAESRRYCPETAERVMDSVLAGEDYRCTGLPPHFPHADGSFANGGAMRASSLGIAFRNATRDAQRRAAAEAIRSSHVHPEAVEGAFLQLLAVSVAARCRESPTGPESFDAQRFLEDLESSCVTDGFKQRMRSLRKKFAAISPSTDDVTTLSSLLQDGISRPGSSFEFQIAAVDLCPCVLWIVARYYDNPEEAIVRAVGIGGDVDTLASLVGAIVGALHGTGWIPRHWWDGLENGTRGRDYAVLLGERLSLLDVAEPLTCAESQPITPGSKQHLISADDNQSKCCVTL